MLKILGSIESTIRPGKGGIRVNSDGREKHSDKAELDSKNEVDSGEINSVEINNSKVKDNEGAKVKNYQKMSKSKKTVGSSNFLTFEARLAFIELRQAFLKLLIFHHFDPKYYILI